MEAQSETTAVVETSDDTISFDKATAFHNAKIRCSTCFGRGFVNYNRPSVNGNFIRDNVGTPIIFFDYCECAKRKLYKEKKKEGDWAWMSYKVDSNGKKVEVLSCG